MQKKDNQLTTIGNFVNSLVSFLGDNTPKNTGALANSYKGEFTINGIEIYGLDYFKFIESGVNGTEQTWGSPYSFSNKMIPISTIQGYADARGINVYALQKSIFKKGIRPKDIITSSIDSKLDNFGDDLIEAIWDDFAEEEKKKDKTIK
jgi:hypothetical protein